MPFVFILVLEKAIEEADEDDNEDERNDEPATLIPRPLTRQAHRLD